MISVEAANSFFNKGGNQIEKREELHKLKLHKPQSDCQYKREKGSDLVIVTPIVATLTEET